MGRDLEFVRLDVIVVDVSIHAPAWGATLFAPCIFATQSSFNSRARVGRDKTALASREPSSGRFNSRARVGRDPVRKPVVFLTWDVSIHAPAWGATCLNGTWGAWTKRFNSRARVGRGRAIL